MTRLEAIDSELTLLAAVRASLREEGVVPGVRQVNELLDKRSQVADAGGAVEKPAG